MSEPPGPRQVLGILVLLTLVAGALRWAGYRRTRTILARTAGWLATAPTSDPDGAARVADRLTRTNRELSPRQASCLVESLALWWELRRRGLDADLCLGVRNLLGHLEAHAWVEHDGVVLNDSPDVATVFVPLGAGAP